MSPVSEEPSLDIPPATTAYESMESPLQHRVSTQVQADYGPRVGHGSKKGEPMQDAARGGIAKPSRVISPTEAAWPIEGPPENVGVPHVHSQATDSQRHQGSVPAPKKRPALPVAGGAKRSRTTLDERRDSDTNANGVDKGGVTDAQRAWTEEFLRKLKRAVHEWQGDVPNHNATDSRPLQEDAATEVAGRAHEATSISSIGHKIDGDKRDENNPHPTKDENKAVEGYMNRCVPLDAAGFAENASLQPAGTLVHTLKVPRLRLLANYPSFFGESITIDGKQHCVMCGQVRPIATKNKASGKPFIPKDHRIRVCSACMGQVWLVVESKLKIKWCCQCKHFVSLVDYGDPKLATCSRCLFRGRENHKKRQIEERKRREEQRKEQHGGNNKNPTQQMSTTLACLSESDRNETRMDATRCTRKAL